MSSLFEPFKLPNGVHIKNRIAKAAMEENMADIELNNSPSEQMMRLYSAWAQGGTGLILSGHVMVDRTAMASEAATCLAQSKDERYLESFRRWIDVCRTNDTKFLLQLNHPGRQMPKHMGLRAKAPSAVALNLGRVAKTIFSEPEELTDEEILRIIDLFVDSALLAEQLGADGIQIHSAHGYLCKQST